jgi:hypothetical protein
MEYDNNHFIIASQAYSLQLLPRNQLHRFFQLDSLLLTNPDFHLPGNSGTKHLVIDNENQGNVGTTLTSGFWATNVKQ